MTCPICGGDTKVIDSAADCECVYRKRKCVECGHKFATSEIESGDGYTLATLREEQRERNKMGDWELEKKCKKLVTILKLVADWAGFGFVGDVRLVHKKSKKEFS